MGLCLVGCCLGFDIFLVRYDHTQWAPLRALVSNSGAADVPVAARISLRGSIRHALICLDLQACALVIKIIAGCKMGAHSKKVNNLQLGDYPANHPLLCSYHSLPFQLP